VGDAHTERFTMKCTLRGCSGEYEQQTVAHTVRHEGELVVIDHVPASVCAVCGDVLFDPVTIRRIEKLLETKSSSTRTAPIYEYAETSGGLALSTRGTRPAAEPPS
jgi:YgiT-type zinc finger domain-containing protein